jgi:hypothetical protein
VHKALLVGWASMAGLGVAAGEEPAPLGYASVAAALEALRADPSAQLRTEGDWTIVASRERGEPVEWFFTHEGHEAHPAVVKRTALERGGVGMIDLVALCHAEQEACNRLVDGFRQRQELGAARARPQLVTLDVGIALDDHERLRVERLLAQEGIAAEIRFTDVLKVVLVPTVGEGGSVLLWTAVYEHDGDEYVPLGEPQLMSTSGGTTLLEMASTSGSRFGFSLASLVVERTE